jgi:hypothetical protein
VNPEQLNLNQIEGGHELCIWFEGIPSFHDATLKELELRQGAPGCIVLHTFKMGEEADANGFFVLSKHAIVTFAIIDLISVELFEFMEAAIIFGLNFERDEAGITLNFDSSYGVQGRIKAKNLIVSFEPREDAA